MIDRLVNGLKNAFYTALTVGTLSFGYVGGCVDNGIEPIKPNQKPVAVLTASPMNGTAPLNVTLDASQSYDVDGKIVRFTYLPTTNYDSTTTFNKINYNYGVGNYRPKVIVEDDKGARDTVQLLENIVVDTLVVPNQKPVAQFTATPTSGEAPLQVSFNGNSSYDSDGTISRYIWEFSDGNSDSTSGAQVQYIYQTAGNKSPGLTVEDNEGARSTKTLANIVVNAAPAHQIAFYSLRQDGTSGLSQDIYLMNLDENYNPIGSSVNLTNSRGQYQNLHPSFSPDGKKIAWERNGHSDGLRKIYVMNKDGSNKEQIITESGLDATEPSWSPDGNWIAFVYKKDSTGIVRIHPNGTGLEWITNISGLPSSLSWSPDGNWIAFSGFYGNVPAIYKIDISNKNLLRLTDGSDFSSSWTPDNNIVFTSERSGGRGDLWEMVQDGTNLRQITTLSGLETDAKFNREKIIFAGAAPNDPTGFTNPTLYLINWDGTDLKQITFEGVVNRYPTWRPKP